MTTLETISGLAPWETALQTIRQERPEAPASITALREEAFSRFAALGFPTTEWEEWRFTNPAAIARGEWRTAGPAPLSGADVEGSLFGEGVDAEIVFVNGVFDLELSRLDRLAKGVTFRPLASVFEGAGPDLPSFGTVAEFRQRPFVALNTALVRDGALLEFGEGVVAGAIHLVFLTEGSRVASTPRVLIRAGRASSAVVVETHAGRGEYFSNAVTEIEAADGAVVDHYKIVSESETGFHVGSIDAAQGRDSSVRTHLVGLGGGFVRNDVNATLDGEGANCELDGLYLLSGRQHFDAHTRIEHAKPHTDSLELYKGILDDQSRGVFNGLIVVRPDAQKVAARQTNKNLLLTNEAIADSNPQLEIHADDVKCNHGSTIGQIDPTALFYLRSRGIGLEEARALLTYAFAREVVDRMAVEPVRRRLEEILLSRLPLQHDIVEGS